MIVDNAGPRAAPARPGVLKGASIMRKVVLGLVLALSFIVLTCPFECLAKTYGARSAKFRVTLVDGGEVKSWIADSAPIGDLTGDTLVIKFFSIDRKEVYIISPKNLIIEEE